MTVDISRILSRLRECAASELTDSILIVSIPDQKLILLSKEAIVAEYPVSTALNGPGNEFNSQKTPLGAHRIVEKIGQNCEPGTVFRGRRATGEMLADFDSESPVEDLITSRILWLDGLETGVNRGGQVDSKQRYIYIHGTHVEESIGKAISHGCIRMKNMDVIDLFDRVSTNDLVYIDG